MPSIGSLLQIGRSGLSAQQKAMEVAAHNIANASTEGYTRQRVVFGSNPTIQSAEGMFQGGVRVANIEHVRDALLDRVYYRGLGTAAESETHASVLGRIESHFGEPSETGLGAAMDQFYSGWSGLASNPNGTVLRSALRQQATVLVQKFRDLAASLDRVRQEVDSRLTVAAGRVTALSSTIAQVNMQIVASESGGATAGDLRDTRGRALAELAELIPIEVTERSNGSIGVTTGGLSIVDGASSLALEVKTVSGTYGLAVVGSSSLLPETGGTIGGLLTVLNTDHPDTIKRLDDLASAFVAEVNTLHKTGTNSAGDTTVDFFDATGTKASSIALSAAVLANPDAIAAGTADGVGAYRAGANDVALGIAALRDTDVASLSMTMGEHYQGLVSDIGLAVRSSSESAEVNRVLSNQTAWRRLAVSSVSVDEELVKLIEFQSVYQASARVISVADEMLQSLLRI